MKNELYKDESISLVASANEDQVDYILNESEGQPIRGILLPYRIHGGQTEYLIRKTLIDGWDAHSDVCALRYKANDDLVPQAVVLTGQLGYAVSQKDIYLLGVVAESSHSNRIFHLTAVQLTRFPKQEPVKSLNGDDILWVKKDDLLTSVDSQLLSAYARLNEYL